MTMSDIHDYIPPRPSWENIGVLFGVGVKPMEIFLSVSVATSFVILVSGSFHPCSEVVGWFVFVSTVGIAMAVIVSVFGTVLTDLMPFVSFAVFLHDLL